MAARPHMRIQGRAPSAQSRSSRSTSASTRGRPGGVSVLRDRLRTCVRYTVEPTLSGRRVARGRPTSLQRPTVPRSRQSRRAAPATAGTSCPRSPCRGTRPSSPARRPGPGSRSRSPRETRRSPPTTRCSSAVAGFRKIAAWATAGAARAAAALADRQAMNPEWPETAGRVSVRDVTGEELALALGCSRRTARHLRHGTGARSRAPSRPPATRSPAATSTPRRPGSSSRRSSTPRPPRPRRAGRRAPRGGSAHADRAGPRRREGDHRRGPCGCAQQARVREPGRAGWTGRASWRTAWPACGRCSPRDRAARMDAVLDRLARSGRAAGDPGLSTSCGRTCSSTSRTGDVPRWRRRTTGHGAEREPAGRSASPPPGRRRASPARGSQPSDADAAPRPASTTGSAAPSSGNPGPRADQRPRAARRAARRLGRARRAGRLRPDHRRGRARARHRHGQHLAAARHRPAVRGGARRRANQVPTTRRARRARASPRPPMQPTGLLRARDLLRPRPHRRVRTRRRTDRTWQPRPAVPAGPPGQDRRRVRGDPAGARAVRVGDPARRRYRIRPGLDAAYLEIGRHDDGPPPF